MRIRRVITGHDAAGKSIFSADGPAPRTVEFTHTPGQSSALVWSTPPVPAVPHGSGDPTPGETSVIPDVVGGTRFLIVTFPPDSVKTSASFDRAAASREALQHFPGLADKFELDNPGMHVTDTVDYAIVLEGEIWLELDDGKLAHLQKHDVVI